MNSWKKRFFVGSMVLLLLFVGVGCGRQSAADEDANAAADGQSVASGQAADGVAAENGDGPLLDGSGGNAGDNAAVTPVVAEIPLQNDSICLELLPEAEQAAYHSEDTVVMGIWLSASENLSFGSFQTELVYPGAQMTLVSIDQLLANFIANKDYLENTGLLVYYPNAQQLELTAQPVKIAVATFALQQQVDAGTYPLQLANSSFFASGTARETQAEDFATELIVE